MVSRLDRELVGALPRLRRFAFSLTRERDAANDLVQQTALRALTAANPPVIATSVLPWLITIARNVFLDERRRAHRRNVAGADFEGEQIGDDGSRSVAVRQALSRLDGDCRAVIELVDVQGHTYAEAAAALAVPIGTVMSRLSRARRKLVADLTPEGDRT